MCLQFYPSSVERIPQTYSLNNKVRNPGIPRKTVWSSDCIQRKGFIQLTQPWSGSGTGCHDISWFVTRWKFPAHERFSASKVKQSEAVKEKHISESWICMDFPCVMLGSDWRLPKDQDFSAWPWSGIAGELMNVLFELLCRTLIAVKSPCSQITCSSLVANQNSLTLS